MEQNKKVFGIGVVELDKVRPLLAAAKAHSMWMESEMMFFKENNHKRYLYLVEEYNRLNSSISEMEERIAEYDKYYAK